jgi:hypothetical protein
MTLQEPLVRVAASSEREQVVETEPPQGHGGADQSGAATTRSSRAISPWSYEHGLPASRPWRFSEIRIRRLTSANGSVALAVDGRGGETPAMRPLTAPTGRSLRAPPSSASASHPT